MSEPCTACIRIRDADRLLVPRHVVHPETGKPEVYDVRCCAVCPTCGGVWRRGMDNRFALLGCVALVSR